MRRAAGGSGSEPRSRPQEANLIASSSGMLGVKRWLTQFTSYVTHTLGDIPRQGTCVSAAEI